MHRSRRVRLHRQAREHPGIAVNAQVVARALTSREGTALRVEAPEAGLEEIEIRLLIEGIRLCYGYDFREYALRPLRRSIADAMKAESISTISAYKDRILPHASYIHRSL